MDNFLQLAGKHILISGFANKKSIAWFTACTLVEAGATCLFTVRSEARKAELTALWKKKNMPGTPHIIICDVENPEHIKALSPAVETALSGDKLSGFVHSLAFANYSDGFKPFNETLRADFLQATTISCFSLIEMSNALKPLLAEDASVVAMSISSTEVTAENYGYMAPIKAALETAVRYLAKSFSHHSRVRFNSVKAGPLKTSASAGIPGYIPQYLHAEKLTLRGENLRTQEVADCAVYLLSGRSSGINAQGIVVNAGMDNNYFDARVVEGSAEADA